MENPSH